MRRAEDVDVGRAVPAPHLLLDEGAHPLGDFNALGRVRPQVRVVDAGGLRDEGAPPAGGELEDLCCGVFWG